MDKKSHWTNRGCDGCVQDIISFNIANILDKIPILHSCISTVSFSKMASESEGSKYPERAYNIMSKPLFSSTKHAKWVQPVTKTCCSCITCIASLRPTPIAIRPSLESYFSILLSFFSFCCRSANFFRHNLSRISD